MIPQIFLTIFIFVADTAFAQVRADCGTSWCNQVVGCPQQNCFTQRNETLTCAQGFILENNVCVKKEIISCPEGTVQIGNDCVSEYTVEPQCPAGTELRNNQCVIVHNRICPFGYAMENNICVRKEFRKIQCPPGSYLQNNECIRVECPKDYTLINGQCILTRPQQPCSSTCPSGYFLNNGICLQNTNTTCNTQVCPPESVPATPNCYPPSPPLTQPPVPPPLQCPVGSDLVNGQCIRTTIVCPPGYTQRGNNCEKISCPPTRSWSGEKCVHVVVVGGNTTNLVNNTHVTNNFNNVTHDTNVNVHNLNNVYIYKGGEVVKVTNQTSAPVATIEPVVETKLPTSNNCCTVVTPRECKMTAEKKWSCYNRKYQRCGSYCTQPRIQLRPRKPIYRGRVLVMPPVQVGVSQCGGSACVAGNVDCSGCETGGQCSSYCSEYNCPSGGCEYYDQESFCEETEGECDLGCC